MSLFKKFKDTIKQWQFERNPLRSEISILMDQYRKAEHYSVEKMEFFLKTASTFYPKEFKAFKDYDTELFNRFVYTNRSSVYRQDFLPKLKLLLEHQFHLNTQTNQPSFISIDKKNDLISPMDFFVDEMYDAELDMDFEDRTKLFQLLLEYKAYDPQKLNVYLHKTSCDPDTVDLIQQNIRSNFESEQLHKIVDNTPIKPNSQKML